MTSIINKIYAIPAAFSQALEMGRQHSKRILNIAQPLILTAGVAYIATELARGNTYSKPFVLGGLLTLFALNALNKKIDEPLPLAIKKIPDFPIPIVKNSPEREQAFTIQERLFLTLAKPKPKEGPFFEFYKSYKEMGEKFIDDSKKLIERCRVNPEDPSIVFRAKNLKPPFSSQALLERLETMHHAYILKAVTTDDVSGLKKQYRKLASDFVRLYQVTADIENLQQGVLENGPADFPDSHQSLLDLDDQEIEKAWEEDRKDEEPEVFAYQPFEREEVQAEAEIEAAAPAPTKTNNLLLRNRGLKTRKLGKLLKQEGFAASALPGNGSHKTHGNGKKKLTVAFHGGGATFAPGTLKSMLSTIQGP